MKLHFGTGKNALQDAISRLAEVATANSAIIGVSNDMQSHVISLDPFQDCSDQAKGLGVAMRKALPEYVDLVFLE